MSMKNASNHLYDSLRKHAEDERKAELVRKAAHDLLEALHYMVGADNDIQDNRGSKSDQAMNRIAALDMAARAIAKAEGKS